MKIYILCTILLINVAHPLMSITKITFAPQKSELSLTHSSQLHFSETDTLRYAFKITNKKGVSSTLSFSYIAKRKNYVVAIGDIKNDIRINLLSGKIYTSTKNLFSYNNSMNLQITTSPTLSLLLTTFYKTISINPFITTHIDENDTYISGGVVIDSPNISSGVSLLTSLYRNLDQQDAIVMFNQKALQKGLSSYILLKQDRTLFDLYVVKLRFAITHTLSATQKGGSAYLFQTSIEKGDHLLLYTKKYYPHDAYEWNETRGKKKSLFTNLEYSYGNRYFTFTYLYTNTLYQKGVYANVVGEWKNEHSFSFKGERWLLTYFTQVDVNEKSKRKEDKKIRFSYSIYNITYVATLQMKNSSYHMHNKITYETNNYKVSVELDHTKRVFYTISIENNSLPFDVTYALSSKNGATITFTIDQ